MEVWGAQLLCLALLLVLALVCGLVAVKLVLVLRPGTSGESLNRSRAEFFLSLLNCFAGGVFLGTSFLHLLPELKESMDSLLEEAGVNTNFALAETVVCLGFFLVMAIEHTVMACQHHHGDVPMESLDNSCQTDQNSKEETLPIAIETQKPVGYGAMDDRATYKKDLEKVSTALEKQTATNYDALEKETDVLVVGMVSRLQGGHGHGHSHSHSHDHGQCHTPSMMPVVQSGTCTHIIHPSHHHNHHLEINQLKGVRSFILFLALSIHAIFEGLALGLQTTVKDTWNLFIAVVIHKCVLAFSLGVQCAENLPSTSRTRVYMVLFSLIAPLGVVLGIAVNATSGNSLESNAANVCLQGISTGTFIYVTFFEVLQREVGQDHSLLKVLGVVLGFTLIALLFLFNGEPAAH